MTLTAENSVFASLHHFASRSTDWASRRMAWMLCACHRCAEWVPFYPFFPCFDRMLPYVPPLALRTALARGQPDDQTETFLRHFILLKLRLFCHRCDCKRAANGGTFARRFFCKQLPAYTTTCLLVRQDPRKRMKSCCWTFCHFALLLTCWIKKRLEQMIPAPDAEFLSQRVWQLDFELKLGQCRISDMETGWRKKPFLQYVLPNWPHYWGSWGEPSKQWVLKTLVELVYRSEVYPTFQPFPRFLGVLSSSACTSSCALLGLHTFRESWRSWPGLGTLWSSTGGGARLIHALHIGFRCSATVVCNRNMPHHATPWVALNPGVHAFGALRFFIGEWDARTGMQREFQSQDYYFWFRNEENIIKDSFPWSKGKYSKCHAFSTAAG